MKSFSLQEDRFHLICFLVNSLVFSQNEVHILTSTNQQSRGSLSVAATIISVSGI